MVKGFKMARDAEIIGRWFHPFDGFQMSPNEFYCAVEQAMNKRRLPDVCFRRVVWQEGGMLSAEREYLRLEWRRYLYDMCAASMGTGFFFSSWLCEKKPKLSGWHVLGIVVSLVILVPLCLTIFLAIPIIGSLAMFVFLMRRGTLKFSRPSEEFFYGLTIIIPLIDIFGRPMSYFEADSASMFQSVAHAAFLEAIDGVTDLQGIPRLTADERKPVMKDFFKK